VIYYVGPVDPVRDEVVGPAGPTTATRMDKFTEMMLAQTGLIAMIGKAERGPVRDRGDQEAQERLPDGGRRRRLPGLEGDQRRARVGFADLGHGSDLRVRRARHAGHRRGRFDRRLGARGPARRSGRRVFAKIPVLAA
jgi:hypothetical protein